MTSDFSGGRFSAAIAAPDSDRSMMRQVILVPSSSVSIAIGLRGTIRSWRRSSGRLRMSRLASQVSWAASLSRLRGGRADRHGKAVVDDAGDLALDPADMVEIGDHAVADIADAGRQQGQSARRHVDDLAGKFAAVRQHVAAEQVHLHPLEAPPLLGGRKKIFCSPTPFSPPDPPPAGSQDPKAHRVNAAL